MPEPSQAGKLLYQKLFADVKSLKMTEPPSPFETVLGPVPEKAKKMFAASIGEPTSADEPDGQTRYGVVVVESGEFPLVKLFKTAENMATYVGTLEGQDVCVVCFHGQFLPITAGPLRHIILGTECVSVPRHGGTPVVLSSRKIKEEQEIQEDGFIGPPELAISYGDSNHRPTK